MRILKSVGALFWAKKCSVFLSQNQGLIIRQYLETSGCHIYKRSKQYDWLMLSLLLWLWGGHMCAITCHIQTLY